MRGRIAGAGLGVKVALKIPVVAAICGGLDLKDLNVGPGLAKVGAAVALAALCPVTAVAGCLCGGLLELTA